MKDKFTLNPENKLEDALAMLAAGISVADILADAADDADWLRPLLEVAAEVEELGPALKVPPPDASLQRMLAYSQELAAVSQPAAPGRSSWLAGLATLLGGGWVPRLATGLVSAMLLVLLLGGTLTILAERSLPGQPLYSLKRAGEMLRLNLNRDPDQRAQIVENYNERRQAEAIMLMEQNQVATVAFVGQLAAVTGASLRVDDLAIQLTRQTQVTGNLAAGAQVQVEVQTQPPDRLVALAVTVIEPAPPSPTPLPSPTATLTPTPSPTTTPHLSSTGDTLKLPSLTPTATPTDLPTSTPTLPPPTATPILPTATSSVSPLLPPTVGSDNQSDNNENNNGSADEAGNGNENTNDSGSDNSGSGSDNSDSGSDDSGGSNSGSGSSNSGSGSSGGDGGHSDGGGSGND
jgi:uncharacterized membrane protein YgcG